MPCSLPAWLCLGASLLLAACGGEPVVASPRPEVVLELALETAPDLHRPVAWPAALRPRATRAGRHAWDLDALFSGGAARPGARVAVFAGEGGQPRMIRPAEPPAGRAWFLVAQGAGPPDLVLADREDPLGGGEDREARVGGVKLLRLLVGRAPEPEPPDEQDVRRRLAGRLRVTVDGTTRDVTAVELDRVASTPLPGEREGDVRLAFSVRALVRVLGGDGARLAGVDAADGRTLLVHERQWLDADREPWLRLNRRGSLKFHWTDREGRILRDGALRDVTGLQLVGR